MKKESFASYDFALWLRERKFDTPCLCYWHQNYGRDSVTGGDVKLGVAVLRKKPRPFGEFDEGYDWNSVDKMHPNIMCSAPHYSQVVDWFLAKGFLVKPYVGDANIFGHRIGWAIETFSGLVRSCLFSGLDSDKEYFNTTEEAYRAAFDYIKTHLYA